MITAEAAATAKVPSLQDRVYKDECMYSFDTPFSHDGLYTSLSTFKSFGRAHVRADYERHEKPLYLRQIHRRVRKKPAKKAQNGTSGTTAPTKLAIGVEGGFELGATPYDVVKKLSIVTFPSENEIPYPSEAIPNEVIESVEAIMKRDGVEIIDNIAMAWEDEERKVSKYAESLEQLEISDERKRILSDPANWKCEDSGLTSNIWLNLSTGHIGSGRKNFDGSGGTGASLAHFMETGEKFPLAVKLGTITSQGADVFSYAEDEKDMVINPKLKEHLAHFGIDMDQQEKTERTMTELQVEYNAKYDFSKITESGSELVPLVGPGFVGLENLGNSCYMASILQLVFTVPEISKRYFDGAATIRATAPVDDPTEDLLAMMAKVGEGLLSKRYAEPIPIYERLPEDAKEGELPTTLSPKQPTDDSGAAVRPFMFKRIIGKNHFEFASGRQQDASEFFQHLLDKLVAAEFRGAKDRLMTEGESEDDFVSTSALFSYQVEEKYECQQSKKSRYLTRVENMFSLPIPLDKASNIQKVKEYEDRTSKRQKMDTNGSKADEEEPVKLNIPFSAVLESFQVEELIDDFVSTASSRKGTALKRTRFRSFPEYLVVQLKKYIFDPVTYNPKKLDVIIPVPLSLDISHLRSTGPAEDEELLPENSDDAMEIDIPAEPKPAQPQPNPAIVSQLMEMGFSENGSKRAAVATNNVGAAEGMEWVLQHMNDPDFNDPLPGDVPVEVTPGPSASAGSTSSKPVPEETVTQLMGMGFSRPRVEEALVKNDNSMDRALEWLIANPDNSPPPPPPNEATPNPMVQNQALENLKGMGFSEKQATAALIANNSAVDRAVEWLFSQGDGLDAAVDKVLEGSSGASNEEAAKEIGKKFIDGEGKYNLVGFASHIGSNTNCGHYVAHIIKDGKFVLFNDSKVAISQNPPSDLGFLYFYRRAS